jgi:hypothetical protein
MLPWSQEERQRVGGADKSSCTGAARYIGIQTDRGRKRRGVGLRVPSTPHAKARRPQKSASANAVDYDIMLLAQNPAPGRLELS